jgi:hypothetical protein
MDVMCIGAFGLVVKRGACGITGRYGPFGGLLLAAQRWWSLAVCLWLLMVLLWWRAFGGGPGRAPQPQSPADPHACALPEITAPATRRDSSARPVCNAAHRSGHIDLRSRSLWGGVQIDQHALRLQRHSRALTPDSTQPVRVHPASESGKQRERSAVDRSRRMSERP